MEAPKVTGHRQLTHGEIALVNEGKAIAIQCGAFIDKLKAHPEVDQRWVSLGATHLQIGFMGVVRGITKPETF